MNLTQINTAEFETFSLVVSFRKMAIANLILCAHDARELRIASLSSNELVNVIFD